MSDEIKIDEVAEDIKRLRERATLVGDCYDGHATISAKSKKYLHQFPTESDAKYKWRVQSSIFINYVASAINGTAGMALKTLPQVEDDELKPLIKQTGEALVQACKESFIFLVVDAPKLETENQQTNTPTLTIKGVTDVYKAIYRDGVLTDFVFGGSEVIGTGLATKEQHFIKHFWAGGGQKYVKQKNNSYEKDGDEWTTGLSYVPVVPVDISIANKHPFGDIADQNIYHYNLNSDLRNILHIIGSPLHIFFGTLQKFLNANGQAVEVKIGADKGHSFGDKQTEGIEIIEAEGNGVAHIRDTLKDTEELIIKQAVSVLTSENYQTATQAESSNAKSIGFLPFVVNAIEQGFESAVLMMSEFRGKAYNGAVILSKDFSATEFNETKANLILALHDKSLISDSTLLQEAKRIKALSSAIDVDEELEKAKENSA